MDFDFGDLWFDAWLLGAFDYDPPATQRTPRPKFLFAHDDKVDSGEQVIDGTKAITFFKQLKTKGAQLLKGDEKKKFKEVIRYIEDSEIAPFVDSARYQFDDAVKKIIIEKMMDEAVIAAHPLNSESHPHAASYLAMMKAMAEHGKENGNPLPAELQQQLNQSIVSDMAERLSIEYDGTILSPAASRNAIKGIYENLGKGLEKYQDIVAGAAKKQKKTQNNADMGLIAGGLIAAAGVASHYMSKTDEQPTKTDQKEPEPKKGGISFAKAAMFVGAVIIGWAAYTKFAPANKAGAKIR